MHRYSLIVLVLISGAGLSAHALTWSVCSEGCDYTSIQDAVDGATSGDTIELGGESFHEQVEVTKALTIRGAGPESTVVDGSGSGTVFYTGLPSALGILALADMTIQNGLTGVEARHIQIDNCIIRDNIDSGVYLVGGGGTINDSLITENTGLSGGGVRFRDGTVNGGSLTIGRSVISGNSASGSGGGVSAYLGPGTSGPELLIDSTLIVGNSAEGGGGGVYCGNCAAVISSSTVTGNTAASGGGGVFAAYTGLTILESTITGNQGDGIGVGFPWETVLKGSIVAGNYPVDCDHGYTFPTSAGHNISSDASCGLNGPGDMEDMDPLLGLLADNGGPTPTHALAPGSPAIDAGGEDCEPLDQRGVTRPQDGDSDGIAECDIGAFEVIAANQPPMAICLDVVVEADDNCLAIADVDGGSFDPEGGPITVSQDPPGPYGLGQTVVTLAVTDDHEASDSCMATVTVEDATPPALTVSLLPVALWPPNHRMVEVEASWSATDNCGTPSVLLMSVTSNEADNGEGDGNTVDDIQSVETGVADAEFQLRAERAGGGNGRIYAATYTATDASGNTGTAAGFAVVPHDQGGAVDPIEVFLDHDAYGTALWWIGPADAESYNVIRSDLSEIVETEVVIDLGVVTCIEAASTDTNTAGFEDPEMPAPGQTFLYLVEYFDGTTSSYGTESASKPRAPAQGACQ